MRRIHVFVVMEPVLEDNVRCVDQATELVLRLGPGIYTAANKTSAGASIGGHIRHNIDHYRSFLLQVDGGAIDYDDRLRELAVEHDPGVAFQRLTSIRAALSALAGRDLDRAVNVRTDSGLADDWSRSTLRRELQFLLSHSVHHYAIIAMICRLNDVEIPEDFGVAPSTIKHRQAEAGGAPSCAL